MPGAFTLYDGTQAPRVLPFVARALNVITSPIAIIVFNAVLAPPRQLNVQFPVASEV